MLEYDSAYIEWLDTMDPDCRAKFEYWELEREFLRQHPKQRKERLKSDDLEEFLSGYDPAEVGGAGSQFAQQVYNPDTNKWDLVGTNHLSGQEYFDKLLALARAQLESDEYKAQFNKQSQMESFAKGIKPAALSLLNTEISSVTDLMLRMG